MTEHKTDVLTGTAEETKIPKKTRAKKPVQEADPTFDVDVEFAPSAQTIDVDADTERALNTLKVMASRKGKGQAGPEARPGKFAIRRTNAVHSVDSNSTVVDEAAVEQKQAEYALYQSYMSKRILSGRVFTVRRAFDREAGGEKVHFYVAVMNGPFQVYIPAEQFIEMDLDELHEMYKRHNPERTKEDAIRLYLNHRMDAEIDYIVTNIPQDGDLKTNMVVAGSRIEAMRRQRIHFWFGTTNDGVELLKLGEKAEARIVATSRSGIRVEVFGVETYIPSRELSWNLIQDAAKVYQVGDRIIIKVTDVRRDMDNDYAVTFDASVKQAAKDPREQGMRVFQENGVYTGVINYIRVPTPENPTVKPCIFVKLAEGVQCMCNFPHGSVPPVEGAKVYVSINYRDEVKKYLFGKITHVCT